MRDRTVTISSGGKTFSFTGWKVGWVCAPPTLVAAVRTAKQFLTYVNGGPFQYAIAAGLGLPATTTSPASPPTCATSATGCRAGLADAGFDVFRPQGTYFVTADIRPLGEHDGLAFCRSLPERCGVVAVPNVVFYDDMDGGRAARALRVLQAPRGASTKPSRRLAEARRDEGRRDPARHRVGGPGRELRARSRR